MRFVLDSRLLFLFFEVASLPAGMTEVALSVIYSILTVTPSKTDKDSQDIFFWPVSPARLEDVEAVKPEVLLFRSLWFSCLLFKGPGRFGKISEVAEDVDGRSSSSMGNATTANLWNSVILASLRLCMLLFEVTSDLTPTHLSDMLTLFPFGFWLAVTIIVESLPDDSIMDPLKCNLELAVLLISPGSLFEGLTAARHC